VIRAGRLQKLAVGRAKNPARRPVGRPKVIAFLFFDIRS